MLLQMAAQPPLPQPATLAGELGEAALRLVLCASIRRNLQPQHVFRLQLECLPLPLWLLF